jgi:nucleoid DNA-binding protein
MRGDRNKKSDIVHRKGELDREVALLLGMKQADVSVVTNEFLRAAMRHLVELEGVRLDGFGEMYVSVRRGGTRPVVLRHGNFKKGEGRDARVRVEKKYQVSFKRAAPFKDAITARHGHAATTEPIMEKYGVDESSEEQEKKAAAGCPNCGGKVEKHGNVLACAKCGTEPFEAQKKG